MGEGIGQRPKKKSIARFFSLDVITTIVGILGGLTALWLTYGPDDDPTSNVYIEFLIDASESMNQEITEGKRKWDEVLSVVDKTFAYEIDETDFTALRVFGGTCEDETTNTELLVPFSTDAKSLAMEKLKQVQPGGKPTLESGIVSLTGDFIGKDSEQTEIRVVAILGSAPVCTNYASKILSRRLGDRFDYVDFIVIGYRLSKDEKNVVRELVQEDFVTSYSFAENTEELEVAINSIKQGKQGLDNRTGNGVEPKGESKSVIHDEPKGESKSDRPRGNVLDAMKKSLELVEKSLVQDTMTSESDFLASYRQSFMQSCIDSAGGREFSFECLCVLDRLLLEFSVEELKDDDLVGDYIANIGMKMCADTLPYRDFEEEYYPACWAYNKRVTCECVVDQLFARYSYDAITHADWSQYFIKDNWLIRVCK